LWTDRDTFFPSVYQRYQQILLPTLQFLVAYASHLTAKHATDRKRELFAFILAHRDAFISVMHQVVSAPTLKLLEQACMILHLLALTGPLAAPDEFTSPSSFGGIHSAVLTMTNTVLVQTALDSITPSTEQEEAAALDRGSGDVSAFEGAKRTTTLDLINGVLAYLYTMSTSSNGIRPVLTSEVTEAAQAVGASGFAVGYPSSVLPGRYPSLATCLVFIRKQMHTLTRQLSEAGQLPETKARSKSSTQSSAVHSLRALP
jgi:nuclear pore complex protein Nup205